MTVWLIVLAVSAPAFSKPVTEDMTEFNKRCPAPAECSKLNEAQERCAAKKSSGCRDFVRIYKKLIPEYDCQRPEDTQSEPKQIVPAIWLCETYDSALDFLSKLETKDAKQLYGSESLKESLKKSSAKD